MKESIRWNENGERFNKLRVQVWVEWMGDYAHNLALKTNCTNRAFRLGLFVGVVELQYKARESVYRGDPTAYDIRLAKEADSLEKELFGKSFSWNEIQTIIQNKIENDYPIYTVEY